MELASRSKELRYEAKYVAPSGDRNDVLCWIANNAAGFRQAYPPRQVNNVYFDSHGQAAYGDNLTGVSHRAKVRLRWYGATDEPDRSALEIKLRRDHVGWKETHAVGSLSFSGRRWTDLRRALRAELPPAGRLWLDANPQPVLINRYQRCYFVSGDGRVRVTLDSNQEFFDQRLAPTPNLLRRDDRLDTLVVEFKFSREDHRRANRFVQGIPLRLSRNSKYVIGFQLLRGN